MKKKHLPRLWCALQGLLPLEECLAAQRAELAWPPEPASETTVPTSRKTRIRVAASARSVDGGRRGTL